MLKVRVWLSRLWGVALALAGGLLVLQLAALLIWQYGMALETRSWPPLALRLVFVDHAALAAKPIAPLLQFIPEVQWGWFLDPANRSSLMHQFATWVLSQVHIGVVPAILGAALAFKGVLIVLRQRGRLEAARQYKEDRLRRVHEYRKQQNARSAEPQIRRDDDDELIEAAERAWRRDRMKVLRG
jgi:hypothetical protein